MGINTKLSGLAIVLAAQQTGAAPIGAFDQYTLELLNGFRANPQAAADAHLGGNLNEGLLREQSALLPNNLSPGIRILSMQHKVIQGI